MRQTSLAILLHSHHCVRRTCATGRLGDRQNSHDDEAVTLREPRQIKIFTSDRVIYTYYYYIRTTASLPLSGSRNLLIHRRHTERNHR